jgi:quercetin dioxygenase-like cupin family protein
MYERIIDTGHLDWSPLDFEGISIRILHRVESTGALTVMTRMAPGSVIPAHSHGVADETVYVLEGDFIEDGVSYGAGTFFVGPAGIPHGPHRTSGGCVLLTTFSAELDFRLVEGWQWSSNPGPPGQANRAHLGHFNIAND